MGRFDVCLKRVFSKTRFFADVFNGFYHEGRQVINPGQLTDQPVQEAYFTTRQAKGKERKVFLVLGGWGGFNEKLYSALNLPSPYPS